MVSLVINVDTALSLVGRGRLDYMINQNKKRDYLLRQSLKRLPPDPVSASSLDIKFRTRSKNGILIHVQESSNYTTVKVRLKQVLDCLIRLHALLWF